MQNWTDFYKELANKIANELPEVKWIDLWHNQVNFLDTEHAFPTPAVFLAFRSSNIEDLGIKVQKVTLQVDVYLFYETFADTYKGSWNQDEALGFLEIFDGLFAALHGSSGENFSSMRRINFTPVDTGNSGNLYLQTFACELIDYSAQKAFEEGGFSDLEVERHNSFDLPE